MWRRFARWLRTPPRVRWSWPRDRPAARRAGPARVVALRFIDAWGDDLQLRNEGPGDAADVVVTALLCDAPGAERRLGAALPSLGAGVGYIVTLRPGRGAPPASGTGAGCTCAGATPAAGRASPGPRPDPERRGSRRSSIRPADGAGRGGGTQRL